MPLPHPGQQGEEGNQREQDGHGNVYDDVGGHEHAQQHEEAAQEQVGHVDADAGVNGAVGEARHQGEQDGADQQEEFRAQGGRAFQQVVRRAHGGDDEDDRYDEDGGDVGEGVALVVVARLFQRFLEAQEDDEAGKAVGAQDDAQQDEPVVLERFRVRRELELAVCGRFPGPHANFIRLERLEEDVPGRVGRRVEYPVEEGGEQLAAFMVQGVYLAAQAVEELLEVADLLLFLEQGFFQGAAGVQGLVPLHQGGFRQVVRVDFLQGFRQFFDAPYFLVQPFLLSLEVRPLGVIRLDQAAGGLAVKGQREDFLIVQGVKHGGHFIHPGVKVIVGGVRLLHQRLPDGHPFFLILFQDGDFMAQGHDDGVHFRVVRLRLGLLGGEFLHLFRNGGRRALLLCRSMARGQHTCQEEGGAAAEKRPVIRDAHERFQF